MKSGQKGMLVAAAIALGCESQVMEGATPSAALCDEMTSSLSSAEELTTLGFRPADIIAYAARDFTTSIVWGAPPNVSFGPEVGRQSLTVQIAYGGGKILFVQSRGDAPTCVDRLEIPVTVRIRSEGGALDETFDTRLVAPAAFYATLTHRLNLEELAGTFAVTDVGLRDARFASIVLDVALSPLGTTGQIIGGIEIAGSDSIGFTDVYLGTWPASDACKIAEGDAPGLPVSLDTPVASFTGQAGLELFNGAATSLLMHWDDGTASPLTLSAEPLGEGCVHIVSLSVLRPHFWAAFPTRLAVATGDGRLAGEYPARLMLVPAADGALQGAQARADLKLPVSESSASGFRNLGELTAFDELSLSFFSLVEGRSLTGSIVLAGLKADPCTSQPAGQTPGGGTPPCQGTIRTVIEQGSW